MIDIKRTAFNVVTKSGSTSETMAQLLIVFDLLKKHCGGDFASRVIATTDESKATSSKSQRNTA